MRVGLEHTFGSLPRQRNGIHGCRQRSLVKAIKMSVESRREQEVNFNPEHGRVEGA